MSDKNAKEKHRVNLYQIENELKEDFEDIDLTKADLQAIAGLIDKKNISMYCRDDMTIADIVLDQIKAQHDRAFLLVDIGSVFRSYKLWKKYLPEVEIFYAVKSNPDVTLLTAMASLNINFDCASPAEISLITSLDVNADRIVYANPNKDPSEIRFAHIHDVTMMTFDCLDELIKIRSLEPEDGYSKLVLRIAVDDCTSRMPFSSKFGCRPEEMDPILEMAKHLRVNIVGCSFHVGSGATDPAVYANAIARARQVFRTMADKGFSPYLLDVGGGMSNNAESGPMKFETVARVISTAIEEHFSDVPGLRVIAEPGRFMSENTSVAVVSTKSKKMRREPRPEPRSDPRSDPQPPVPAKQEEEPERPTERENCDADVVFHYTLNSSIYGLFNNCVFDDKKIELNMLRKSSHLKRFRSVFFGQTCDSRDKIVECEFPQLFVGDVLYVENMGSYSLSSASTFNGFPLPETSYIFTY